MKFFTLMLLTSALVSCRQGGELANESLNGGKITNGTVSELKIADASVTPAKLDRSYQESLPVSGNAGDYLTGNLVWADFATAVRGSVSAQLMPVTPLLYDPGTGVFALDTVTPAFGGTGLTALGTPNQVLGVVGAGGAAEYKTIAGTMNQVTVTHGANTITLSAAQDISQTSTPRFAGVNLTNLLNLSIEDAATNSATTVATVAHTTTATAAAGFGTTLEFSAEQDSDVVVAQGQITSSWTSAAAGAESSQLAFSTLNMGVPTQALVLSPEGSATVAGGIATRFRASSTATTLTASDSVLSADSTAAGFIVNLPSAVGIAGRQYTIKKVVAGNFVDVLPFGAETIDGVGGAYLLTASMQFVVLVSDGANWLIVGGN